MTWSRSQSQEPEPKLQYTTSSYGSGSGQKFGLLVAPATALAPQHWLKWFKLWLGGRHFGMSSRRVYRRFIHTFGAAPSITVGGGELFSGDRISGHFQGFVEGPSVRVSPAKTSFTFWEEQDVCWCHKLWKLAAWKELDITYRCSSFPAKGTKRRRCEMGATSLRSNHYLPPRRSFCPYYRLKRC